jgi:hypothetical protein
MRSEVGLGATALLLAGAVGIGSQHAKAPTASINSATGQAHVRSLQTANKDAKHDFDRGPCGDLEDTLRAFLLAPDNEIAAPSSCYGADPANREYLNNQKAALSFQQKAGNLQFIIATLPDPLHTHFSLSFDRNAEAIQQAAQDEGYFYDSSWLPWETEEKPLVLLDDQGKADKEKKAREEQPGVLLFRGKSNSQGKPADDPYTGLAVFIVGEEPTRGIHKTQFRNAVDWIAALTPSPSHQVKILGPNFSGSLPSLAQLLSEARQNRTISTLYAGSLEPLSIYSGGVSSNTLVNWFIRKEESESQSSEEYEDVRFRSFQRDGISLFRAYRPYLRSLGFEASHLAILSEDETAYGGYGREAADPLCKFDPTLDKRSHPEGGPTCLYYPRDLSALRTAYQKEGIFNAGAKAESPDSTQRQLASYIADPEGDEHDTIRTYSGEQLALAQEAILAQIVSMLQAHASQYIVLRSSNPLDQLFLSHYLRQAYPAGRIVIEGSDLLLRRETGSAALSGVMTLTSYPLLPWGFHWAVPKGEPPYIHAHRVFDQEGSEGSYIALRFLLNARSKRAVKDLPSPEYQNPPPIPADYQDIEDQSCNPESDCTFLMPNRFEKLSRNEHDRPEWNRFAIPDYNAPFWNISTDDRRPSVWLSVLGRDGFWPVAALRTPRDEPDPSLSKDVWETLRSWAHLFATLFPFVVSGADHTGWPDWPPMPLSMKLCLLWFFVLAGFHLHCCARPSITVKPVHRAHFVRFADCSHSVLILFGTLVVAFIPILLTWGYGVMSLNGEPVPYALWYRALLPLSWLMAALAVWLNAWDAKRQTTSSAAQATPSAHKNFMATFPTIRESFLFKKDFWSLWRATIPFLISSVILFLLVDFFLEQSLDESNRIPTYWRSIHLTTGVSPLVPLLALTAGLYAWFWYSLQGLALFGPDRPRLPSQFDLQITTPEHRLNLLTMFSSQGVAEPLKELSDPLNQTTRHIAMVLFLVIAFGAWAIAGWNVPIRNLGSELSSVFCCLYMDLCISLMLANAWQFMRIWLQLRNLLLFLDRIALRRTTKRLKDISWGSVWNMSGSILDVRYKLLSRQSESLTHLWNSIPDNNENNAWRTQLKRARDARDKFAKWYAENWNAWEERDLSALENFQTSIAKAAGYTLSRRLLPAWKEEKNSLILEFEEKKDEKSKEDDKSDEDDCSDSKHEPKSLQILNAEELVCLVYLGFVQNILGRLRTLVMQMLWLFLALSAAAATYPFDPRPALSGTMMVLFLIVGTVVVIVYAQMHRDGTLSLVTNTTPGELGIDFWIKLAGFSAGPILGLLAANFPGVTGSLFSWLQPGLESLK